MLKTRWRKFKSPAAKPVFPVEFNILHWVFHNLVRHSPAGCVQFVIFKSEIWQFFDTEPRTFCNFLQYQIDECGFVLKIHPVPNAEFPSLNVVKTRRKCCIIAAFSSCSDFSGVPALHKKKCCCQCVPCLWRKTSALDWFYQMFGVYLTYEFVKPCAKARVGTTRPQ